MTKAIVKEIGEQAISPKDKMIILFDNQATPELRTVSVMQEIDMTAGLIELKINGEISFDDQTYKINYVGSYAIEQLNTIGHVTLVFKEVPKEDRIVNGIYLEPFNMPELSQGTVITYH